MSQVVDNARSLLLIGAEIAELGNSDNPSKLRRRLLEELMSFETTCRRQEILGEEWIMVCRFALCAFLDERILGTPWGATWGWASNTLVGELHRDSSPGETFFLLLERIRPDLTRHLGVGELFYLCLKMGFRGRYGRQPGGDERLTRLVNSLGDELSKAAGGYSAALSVRWEGVRPTRAAWLAHVPVWGWAVVGAGLLIVGAMLLDSWVRFNSEQLATELSAMLREP